MKKYFLLVMSAIVLAVAVVNCSRNDDASESKNPPGAFNPNSFVGVWTAGDDKQIILPIIIGEFFYSYQKVGDATIIGSGKGIGITTISVSSPRDYLISITPKGEFAFIYCFGTEAAKVQFKELKQWGNVTWNTNLWGMFYGCTNLTITATDVPNLSKVMSMNEMFKGCTSITTIPNINKWDVSNVTDMQGMFQGATSFNGDISKWDVSNVTDMNFMFYEATAFNQDISSWDVSKVTSMYSMFSDATAFNQNLGKWTIKEKADLREIFTNSGMSCENYSKTLKGWAENPQTGTEVKLSSDCKYGIGAQQYRDKLKNDKKWNIYDNGSDASCNPDL